MGELKKHYLRNQESRYIRMADALGISWQELLQLDYEIDVDISKDGLVHGYILQFHETNDSGILGKIEKLDEDLRVFLLPWVFELVAEDEYELEAIYENADPNENFLDEISNLDQLLKIDLDKVGARDILFRQIFISIIGALETYLSDTLINKVTESDQLLERFVETHPVFQKQRVSLSDIFQERRSIEKKAKSVMLETIYHKLPTVKRMYEDTFRISFPDISEMQTFISQRHDLVHRNGKTKDGKSVVVSEKSIADLKWSAVKLVKQIEEQMEEDQIPF